MKQFRFQIEATWRHMVMTYNFTNFESAWKDLFILRESEYITYVRLYYSNPETGNNELVYADRGAGWNN